MLIVLLSRYNYNEPYYSTTAPEIARVKWGFQHYCMSFCEKQPFLACGIIKIHRDISRYDIVFNPSMIYYIVRI